MALKQKNAGTDFADSAQPGKPDGLPLALGMMADVLYDVMTEIYPGMGSMVTASHDPENHSCSLHFDYAKGSDGPMEALFNDFMGKLEASCIALQENGLDIECDTQAATVTASSQQDLLDMLVALSEHNGMGWEIPLRHLEGVEIPPLDSKLRIKAEKILAGRRGEAILLGLEAPDGGFPTRDDLLTAVLQVDAHSKWGMKRPRYTLDDIENALAAEEKQGSALYYNSRRPGFWFN